MTALFGGKAADQKAVFYHEGPKKDKIWVSCKFYLFITKTFTVAGQVLI